MPRLSFDLVVHRSDQIIAGTVLRSRTAWGPSHEMIWTHYDIQVESVSKGPAASLVTVSEPGGTVGAQAMEVPGTVHYAPGEHVLLFLRKTEVGYNRTVGWSQGKYQIAADGTVHAAGGEAELAAPLGVGHASAAGIDGMRLSAAQGRIIAVAHARQVAQ